LRSPFFCFEGIRPICSALRNSGKVLTAPNKDKTANIEMKIKCANQSALISRLEIVT
jgi:hypothetical protein